MSKQRISPAPRPRLTTLVTAGVAATVLLTVLALLILIDQFALRYVERVAGERLQQLSWQMRDGIDHVMQHAGADVQMLAALPQLRAAAAPADLRAVFERLQNITPDYAWIGLAGTDGKVVAATQGMLEGVDMGARSWFVTARTRRAAGETHPVLLESKLPAGSVPWRHIDAVSPVIDDGGKLRGVLSIHMSWSWARRLMQELLAPAGNGAAAAIADAEIFVVRGDGLVLLGPAGHEGQRLQTAALAQGRAGSAGVLRAPWQDGRIYLTGYASTGRAGDPASLHWSVLVRQPLSAALADARSLERKILLLGALLGLLMAGAAAYVARRYTRPFNALSAQLEQRLALPADAAGLPDIAAVDSFHELQVLSGALTRLVDNERRHLGALRALNEQLESTVAERTREIARKALQLERALAQEHSTQLLLQERAAELRAILDHAHDAFIALDHGAVVLDWNRQAERLIGWRRAEVIGQPLGALVLPPVLRRAYEADMQTLADRGPGAEAALSRRIELTLHHRDGHELPIEASIAYVPRSSGYVFIAFLHDISERRQMIASLEDLALRDTLTGLPNRRALMQALPAALERSGRSGKCCAVLFLDLDRFKQVNDRYSHEEGDELLRQFAARVRGAVRKTDTVGRLAGDEFIVIVEMLASDADAVEAADKLAPLLLQPFVLKTTTVTLGASIGVALHQPGDAADREMLLGRADRAMYADKERRQQALRGQYASATHALH